MATIEKRGETYRITVSAGYDLNGKQIRRSMTYKPEAGMTKRKAEKEAHRQALLFEESIKNGFTTDGNIKFEEFARQWVKQIEREGELKPLTIKRFKQCQERTYKAIGHLKMNKINKTHIQAFINNLAEDGINQQTGGGLSTKTQKLYLNFISDVFNYAIDCDIDVKNPCTNVKVIKKDPKERECYTIDEARTFLTLLETAPIKYKAFFTLAMFGGFRRGELLGFEWSDLDFETGVISVMRTSLFDKEQGGTFTGTPKTKGSQRSLKLPENVIDVLREYKAEQNKQRLLMGDRWVNSNKIFIAENGAPMGVDSARHWLTKFCKRNGLRQVNVHSFRHLNASLLIMNGVDVRTVSAALGHSQTSTTLNIYAHSFQEAQARASETIANALTITPTETKQT